MKTYPKAILLACMLSILAIGGSGCTKVKLLNANKTAANKLTSSDLTELSPGTPGFAVTSGGGVLTGDGIRLEATIGEVSSEVIQTAPGLRVISGVQGANGIF